MFFRLSVLLYGGGLCVYIIYYFIREEKAERDYPTPPEWNWRSRHMLRDAHSWADPAYKGTVYPKTLEVCRNLLLWFERPEGGGEKIPRLTEQEDPDLLVPWEFIPHDLSAMSEEWRRGYYETMMLAAKAAEYCEGWMRDVYSNNISAPPVRHWAIKPATAADPSRRPRSPARGGLRACLSASGPVLSEDLCDKGLYGAAEDTSSAGIRKLHRAKASA
jgi:hypothetical protein